jgi:hypothetical protein
MTLPGAGTHVRSRRIGSLRNTIELTFRQELADFLEGAAVQQAEAVEVHINGIPADDNYRPDTSQGEGVVERPQRGVSTSYCLIHNRPCNPEVMPSAMHATVIRPGYYNRRSRKE